MADGEYIRDMYGDNKVIAYCKVHKGSQLRSGIVLTLHYGRGCYSGICEYSIRIFSICMVLSCDVSFSID